MNSFPILNVRDLTKSYPTGAGPLTVLHDVSFSLAQGSTCSILGPSGSGKTTLLGLAAGLDLPTSGSVLLNGIALAEISEDERARVRNELVGFVFQNFQLIPTLTALENVTVPMELRGDRTARAHALELLRARRAGGTEHALPGPAFRRRTTARRAGAGFHQSPQNLVRRRTDGESRFGDEPEGDRDHAGVEPDGRDRARARDARPRRGAIDRAHDPAAQRSDDMSPIFRAMPRPLPPPWHVEQSETSLTSRFSERVRRNGQRSFAPLRMTNLRRAEAKAEPDWSARR